MTRSKAKTTEWAKQDEIREAAKAAWVEKANEANVKHMHQDWATVTAAAY